MSWQGHWSDGSIRFGAGQRHVIAGSDHVKTKCRQGFHDPVKWRINRKPGHGAVSSLRFSNRNRRLGNEGFQHRILSGRSQGSGTKSLHMENDG